MSHAKCMSDCVYHAMTNITSMHEACRTCWMKHATNMNESVMSDILINSTPPTAQMYCVYGVCECACLCPHMCMSSKNQRSVYARKRASVSANECVGERRTECLCVWLCCGCTSSKMHRESSGGYRHCLSLTKLVPSPAGDSANAVAVYR